MLYCCGNAPVTFEENNLIGTWPDEAFKGLVVFPHWHVGWPENMWLTVHFMEHNNKGWFGDANCPFHGT